MLKSFNSLTERGTGERPAPRVPGFRKANSKIKVVINSRNYDSQLDLSQYVFEAAIGKSIKGTGEANLGLVGAVNWLNIINPNDHINIYFNQNDGQGWVRTFYGLVDRVEENFQVSESGAPKQIAHVICSDFTKAVERTAIYYNPYAGADSKLATFKSYNIQLTLLGKGLLMHGTPADVVANMMFVLMGQGNQFEIPRSYMSRYASKYININRKLRRQFAYSLLSEKQQAGISSLEDLDNEVARFNRRLAVEDPASLATDDAIKKLAEAAKVPMDAVLSGDPEVQKVLTSQYVLDKLLSSDEEASKSGSALGTHSAVSSIIYSNASPVLVSGMSPVTTGVGILDLINVGSFIERKAIDGYTSNITVRSNVQSIYNLLRSYSNEIVNELFFDLRAWAKGDSEEDPLVPGTSWARDPDDVGGNVSEDGINGVTYVPALVMREYPFGTIQAIDGSAIQMSLKAGPKGYTYGIMPVGALFSDMPGVPGRHVIPFPNINAVDRALGRDKDEPAKKHLDVAVVYENEFIATNFGKSDTDHFNVLEVDSLALNQKEGNQAILQDLFPLITPIHIVQHGIRPITKQTQYAWRLPKSAADLNNPDFGMSIQASEGEVAKAAESTDNQVQHVSDPIAPISSELLAPLSPNDRNNFTPFIWGGWSKATNDHLRGRWGYTRRRPGNKWAMHNGIDLHAPPGTPVRAVLDGTVIRIATRPGYGRMIVLRHRNVPYKGGKKTFYTLYAHLGIPEYTHDNKTIPAETTFSYLSEEARSGYKEGITVGSVVKKGDIIGFTGWSAYPGTGGRRGVTGTKDGGSIGGRNTHLHFEVLRVVGGSYYPALRSPGYRETVPDGEHLLLPPWTRGTKFEEEQSRSVDPEVWYKDVFGVELASLLGGAVEYFQREDDDDEPNSGDDPGNNESDPSVDAEEKGFENQEEADASRSVASKKRTPTQGVDGPLLRRLLARWGLLQDHWYQHNVEYLSGTIDMRGAPEIRVGYRLDIAERNLSAYVEQVNHRWTYPSALMTHLKVTRGQPNNPYPVYVLPIGKAAGEASDQRGFGSRLGKWAIIPDPATILRSKFYVYDKNVVPHPTYTESFNNTTDVELDRRVEEYIQSSNFTIVEPEEGTKDATQETEDPVLATMNSILDFLERDKNNY